ncbi:MAG: DUF3971 domain-containing protein, partial [Proteobacteria bacterium]|nr:DUF3971 domain-containing protein [Pseudomonadota bacterium]
MQRPLVTFAVMVFFIFALAQAAGRIGMFVLDRLESPLNSLLAEFDVNVEGLEGRWNGLNPVVQVKRVTFPAGYVNDLLFELDWLESAFRGTPIAARLYASDAEIIVEKTADGWRLAGMGPSRLDYDPLVLIKHSDQIRVNGRLGFADGGAGYQLNATAENRRGVNRLAAFLTRLPTNTPDELRLYVKIEYQEQRFGMGEARQRALVSGDFRIPAQVLGGAVLDVSGVDGAWAAQNRRGGGTLDVERIHVVMPEALATTLDADLRVVGRRDPRGYFGAIEQVTFNVADNGFTLQPIAWATDAQGLRLWLDQLSLVQPAQVIRSLLASIDAADRWLGALNLTGELNNIHGLVNLQGQASYAASLSDFSMGDYRGAPRLRNVAGELIGYEAGAQVAINSETTTLAFPTLFNDEWQVDNLQGVLSAWFKGGSFGLRAPIVRLSHGDSRLVGGFALAIPVEKPAQRLNLLLHLDSAQVADVRTFIPYRIPPGLANWLDVAPVSGTLRNVDFAYQGNIHQEPGDLARKIEATGDVENAVVRYHPDWPLVEAMFAAIHVSGTDTFADIVSATSLGARIGPSSVAVLEEGSVATINMQQVSVDAGTALTFVRRSPLKQALPLISDVWEGAGLMNLSGSTSIPLKAREGAEPPIIVDLSADLEGVDLKMPDYRVSLEALRGVLTYRYPFDVRGDGTQGKIFGREALFSAKPGKNISAVVFDVRGSATQSDIYHVAGLDSEPLARGVLDFTAELLIGVGENSSRELKVQTDLLGLTVLLPGELGKSADERRKSLVNLQFLNDHTALQFSYGNANGWIRLEDAPVRGAVGLGVTAPMVSSASSEMVVSGRLTDLDLVEWFGGEDGQENRGGLVDFPLPVRIQNVVVSRVSIEDVAFADVQLTGDIRNSVTSMGFSARDLAGQVIYDPAQPLKLDLERIYLPAVEAPLEQESDGSDYYHFPEDPFDVEVAKSLFDADVTIGELKVGEDHYGNWAFKVRPQTNAVMFEDLSAQVRGVQISAPTGAMWRFDDVTALKGTLTMTNMAEVLPQWGYSPSLETEAAVLEADISWPGSPANIVTEMLTGELSISAANGHFLDVDSGNALKIFSLLNFSTLAQRLNFDFSDVTGKGVSFKTMAGSVRLADGTLTFKDPLKIDGTGSKFVVAGTVDLRQGLL